MASDFDEDRCGTEEMKFLLIQDELDKLGNPEELDAVKAAMSNGKDFNAAVAEAAKLFSGVDGPTKEIETLRDVYQRAEEISTLPDAGVERRYSELRLNAKQVEGQRRQAQEKAAFYNQPEAAADVAYWNSKKNWHADEAAALSLGKDPRVVNSESLEKKGLRDSPFVADFKARLKRIKRATKASHLQKPIKPRQFLDWAQQEGLSFPAELCEKPATMQSLKLNAKEKSSFYLMILGMAMKHYGFKPEHNAEPGDKSTIFTAISNDLNALKLNVDAKTVKKHLRAASKFAIGKRLFENG